jgi:hypothetical protein
MGQQTAQNSNQQQQICGHKYLEIQNSGKPWARWDADGRNGAFFILRVTRRPVNSIIFTG